MCLFGCMYTFRILRVSPTQGLRLHLGKRAKPSVRLGADFLRERRRGHLLWAVVNGGHAFQATEARLHVRRLG